MLLAPQQQHKLLHSTLQVILQLLLTSPVLQYVVLAVDLQPGVSSVLLGCGVVRGVCQMRWCLMMTLMKKKMTMQTVTGAAAAATQMTALTKMTSMLLMTPTAAEAPAVLQQLMLMQLIQMRPKHSCHSQSCSKQQHYHARAGHTRSSRVGSSSSKGMLPLPPHAAAASSRRASSSSSSVVVCGVSVQVAVGLSPLSCLKPTPCTFLC